MDTISRRFLDQLILDHGPRDLLGRFFLDIDAAFRERGIVISIRTDFEELLAVNEENQLHWASLVPIVHPRKSRLDASTAYWLRGQDSTGRVVCTQAARFFDWQDTNLKEEMRSMRVFYADPAPYLAEGQGCEVTAPSAEKISGRVQYSGAIWAHPDFRGRQLASLIPRVSRAFAYTKWRTDFCFGLVEPILIEKKIAAAYGHTRTEPGITVRGFRGEFNAHLVFRTEAEILGDCRSYVEEAKRNRVRSTDVEETNRLPSVARQGSSSRS
jgi:hypothetical protein